MKTRTLAEKQNLETAEQYLKMAQRLLKDGGEPALSLVLGGIIQKVSVDRNMR